MPEAQKTQHDFNLALVDAFRVTQGQISDLQTRTAALEDTKANRSLVADVDGVAAALSGLADAMPAVPAPETGAAERTDQGGAPSPIS